LIAHTGFESPPSALIVLGNPRRRRKVARKVTSGGTDRLFASSIAASTSSRACPKRGGSMRSPT